MSRSDDAVLTRRVVSCRCSRGTRGDQGCGYAALIARLPDAATTSGRSRGNDAADLQTIHGCCCVGADVGNCNDGRNVNGDCNCPVIKCRRHCEKRSGRSFGNWFGLVFQYLLLQLAVIRRGRGTSDDEIRWSQERLLFQHSNAHLAAVAWHLR